MSEAFWMRPQWSADGNDQLRSGAEPFWMRPQRAEPVVSHNCMTAHESSFVIYANCYRDGSPMQQARTFE